MQVELIRLWVEKAYNVECVWVGRVVSLCCGRFVSACDTQAVDACLLPEVGGNRVVLIHIKGWDEYATAAC